MKGYIGFLEEYNFYKCYMTAGGAQGNTVKRKSVRALPRCLRHLGPHGLPRVAWILNHHIIIICVIIPYNLEERSMYLLVLLLICQFARAWAGDSIASLLVHALQKAFITLHKLDIATSPRKVFPCTTALESSFGP